MRSKQFWPIWLTLTAVLLLVSCTDNSATRSRYNIEKALFAAEKGFRKAGIKPELTDKASMKRLRSQYESVLNQSYQALKTISLESHPIEHREIGELAYSSATRLAQLLFSDGKFDSCVTIFNGLLAKNAISKQSLMRVYNNLSSSLQANGNLDSALTVMDITIEKFNPPLDPDGRLFEPVFDLPSQIHTLFQTLGDTANAKTRFAQAEHYYRQYTTQNGKRNLANASHTNLARLYSSAGRWKDEITELRQLRDSTGGSTLFATIRIADVYSSRLHEYTQAIVIYDSLRAELHDNDTLFEPPLLLKRSIAELGAGQYATARATLVKLEKNHPDYYFNAALAQFSKARTFEKEGDWDRAELEYKYLFEQYTGSIESMSTYLYLARKYSDQSKPDLARQWYERGVDYYNKIAHRGTNSMTTSRALLFKAEAYKRMDDFPSAATTLLDMYERFPKTQAGQLAILEAARIYKNQLGQPQTADSLIEKLKTALAEVDEGQKL